MSKISPVDIIHQEFATGFRGYQTEAVDEFLSQLAQDYQEALEENARLKRDLDEAGRQLETFRASEGLLKTALINAEKSADEIRNNARREGELIVRDAEQRGREVGGQWEQMRQERYRFIIEFRALLQSYLESLSRWEQDTPSARPAAPDEHAE
jgi:cell division initiation protein